MRFFKFPIFVFATFAFSMVAQAAVRPVAFVDLKKYAGDWYQIARNPLFFEKDCVCSLQKLAAASNGTIEVHNSCRLKTPTGALRSIDGFATVEDPGTNAKLSVDFGLPQKGEYWIIGLDADYRYAVVSDPSERSLYILSRTPDLEADLYQKALGEAAAQVNTSNLKLTLQTGCQYP